MKTETLKDFVEWMKQCNMRENTIKGYYNFLTKIPTEISLDGDELELIGKLNNYISQYGSRSKIIFRKFLKFVYERDVQKIENMRERELFRIKKNSVISNLEVTESQRKKEKITFEDVGDMYVPANIILDLINTAPTFEIKAAILILYDTGCRVNEVLDNYYNNFRIEGLDIPKELSKTKRPRYVPYLIPETQKIVNLLLAKRKDSEKMFSLSYMKFYYELKKLGKTVGFRVGKMSLGNFSAISPHWFRHTRTTDLAKTWDIGKIQRRLGWSNPKMLNVYIEYVGNRPVESLEDYMKRTKRKIEIGESL